MMSVPRDLKVDIPGHNKDRYQRRLRARRPARLTVKTVKKLFGKPGEPFKINHIIQVDFGGFRRAINYIGGVYVDIDRDYFNDNRAARTSRRSTSIPATRSSRARTRSTTSAIATATTTSCAPRASRTSCARSATRGAPRADRLPRAAASWPRSSRATPTPTRACGTRRTSSRCSSSCYSRPQAGPRSPLPGRPRTRSGLPDRLAEQARSDRRGVPPRPGLQEAAPTSRASEADRRSASARKKRNRARRPCPASRSRGARERTRRSSAPGAAHFPFYFPTLRSQGSRYAGTEPRIYGIRDERKKLHRAYRLVVSKGVVGEYYGIQGTTWRAPPILDDPSETRKVNGRKLSCTTTGAGCGSSRGARSGPGTGSRTHSRSRSGARR